MVMEDGPGFYNGLNGILFSISGPMVSRNQELQSVIHPRYRVIPSLHAGGR